MESDNVTAPSKGGLPGMRGVEHIGLTVPNLDEATDFFVNVLGCEVVYSLFPLGARITISISIRRLTARYVH